MNIGSLENDTDNLKSQVKHLDIYRTPICTGLFCLKLKVESENNCHGKIFFYIKYAALINI